MKENFFTSMFMEGGKVSHKRVISVMAACAAVFTVVWSVIKYPATITDVLHSTFIFVAVMSGVATVAQIVSLVRGGSVPSQPEKTPDAGVSPEEQNLNNGQN
jgi:hypothetical protein